MAADARAAAEQAQLQPLRTVRIDVGGHPITAAPQVTDDARALLDRLPAITAPGH